MNKGIIICYINRHDHNENYERSLLDSILKTNEEMIKILEDEGYYMLFLVTTTEASRIEKIDYDKPYPRFADLKLYNKKEKNDH